MDKTMQPGLEIRKSFFPAVIKILVLEITITIIHLLIRFIFGFFGLDELAVVSGVTYYKIFVLAVQALNLYVIIYITTIWLSEYYIIEEKQIQIVNGLLNRKSTAYDIHALQALTVNQGFIERIFGLGTIRLYNPTLKEDIYLRDIPNVQNYAHLIGSIEHGAGTMILKRK